jgi:hypothetical protein
VVATLVEQITRVSPGRGQLPGFDSQESFSVFAERAWWTWFDSVMSGLRSPPGWCQSGVVIADVARSLAGSAGGKHLSAHVAIDVTTAIGLSPTS